MEGRMGRQKNESVEEPRKGLVARSMDEMKGNGGRSHSNLLLFFHIFFLHLFSFLDKVSLCSPSWPRTYYVDQAASRGLDLKAYTTTPDLFSI